MCQIIKPLSYKIFQHIMADKFDLKLIPGISGADLNQSIIEWVVKAELVCRLCREKKIECIILMHLTGGVFVVCQRLGEGNREISCLITI